MTTPGSSDLEEQKMQNLEAPQVPPLDAPHYSESSSVFTDEHGYRSLSHCLRTNLFPGRPVVWSSQAKDSYINHTPQAPPLDPQHWHGRRTDDMMRWTERNIINQKLQKALRALEQRNAAK